MEYKLKLNNIQLDGNNKYNLYVKINKKYIKIKENEPLYIIEDYLENEEKQVKNLEGEKEVIFANYLIEKYINKKLRKNKHLEQIVQYYVLIDNYNNTECSFILKKDNQVFYLTNTIKITELFKWLHYWIDENINKYHIVNDLNHYFDLKEKIDDINELNLKYTQCIEQNDEDIKDLKRKKEIEYKKCVEKERSIYNERYK